jgi:hypothetical protein
MTDVDRTRFSGTAPEQPLLGSEVREGVNREAGDASHLPTAHEKREQSEALFRRLLAVGDAVTLIVRSASDSGGRPQGDPPFLSSLLQDEDSGWTIIGPAEMGAEDLIPHDAGQDSTRVQDRGAPRSARVAPEWTRRDAEGRIPVSAGNIDDWRSCPFLYWCRHVADIGTPSDESGLFGRVLQGDVMHSVWQDVWSRYAASGDSGERRTIHATLLAGWDSSLSRLSARNPSLGDPRFAAPMAGLRSVMLNAALLQDGVEARAAEAGLVRVDTRLEYSLPRYSLANTSFSGRADRVDVWSTPSGISAVIVDYKLGASGGYLDSVQLASYAAMMRSAREEGAEDVPVGGFCYIGHADSRLRGGWSPELEYAYRGSGRAKGFDLEDAVERAVGVMNEMDAALAAGEFPARYDSKSCRACAYQSACRRSARFGSAVGEEDSDDGAAE